LCGSGHSVKQVLASSPPNTAVLDTVVIVAPSKIFGKDTTVEQNAFTNFAVKVIIIF
jgi:hypothetical protein